MPKVTLHYQPHGDSHTPLYEGENGNYHLARPSQKMPLPHLTVPQTHVGGNLIIGDKLFYCLFSINQFSQSQWMTGEGKEQEKNKPRKEKARVNEDRELTEKRKGASDMLFVLEIDLNLDESLNEPRIYALELFKCKSEETNQFQKSFIPPIESNCTNFPAHKGKEISIIRSPSRR